MTGGVGFCLDWGSQIGIVPIYCVCDCRFLCLGFRVQIWAFEVPTMRDLINSILPQSVVPIRELELQTLGGC